VCRELALLEHYTRLTEWKYVRNVKVEEITVCKENWKESADERRKDRISEVKNYRVRIKRKIKETLKKDFGFSDYMG
jgi:hypothetical protein